MVFPLTVVLLSTVSPTALASAPDALAWTAALSAAFGASQYGAWGLIGLGLAGAGVFAAGIRRRRRRGTQGPIPLIASIDPPEPLHPPARNVQREAASSAHDARGPAPVTPEAEPLAPEAAPLHREPTPLAPAPAPLAERPVPVSPAFRAPARVAVPVAAAPALIEPRRRANGMPRPSRPRSGSALERVEPSEGETIQILPGRLEIVEGAEPGTDFVFVRMASAEVPEVTLGQAEGPPFRHVRLPAPSVDPVHARMRFEDGHWKIANMSARSSIAVNFKQLQPPDESWPLADGDCIRIGEVVLRYWDRRA